MNAFGAQSHGPLTRCLRFAAPVTRTPRKTRSRLLACSAGRGWLPARSRRKVSAVASPFPKLFPGALNAILYLARGGCTWRMLPHDLPPWKTVSYYFYTWRDRGVWERVHSALRDEIRAAAGKQPTPSLA